MPSIRTEITEIVTGLGMLGLGDVDEALEVQPALLQNVPAAAWQRLSVARNSGEFNTDFEASWANGEAFLRADDALRGRPPARIEWKGEHRPPGYERLPADLRIDHVYLVSCKYLSKVLWNVAPAALFLGGLEARPLEGRRDWFEQVAADAYDWFYAEVAMHVGGLPRTRAELSPADRESIKDACSRRWPDPLVDPARVFSAEVAAASATAWRDALPSQASRLWMLWRLIRLTAAPYFVLGSGAGDSLRLRVGTPWDWNQSFRLDALHISAGDSQQPLVNWRADVTRLSDGEAVAIVGHVEIRWSHGRFCGFPEAKVYLDTPHRETAGYFPIE